jgi:hypothetical protein
MVTVTTVLSWGMFSWGMLGEMLNGIIAILIG